MPNVLLIQPFASQIGGVDSVLLELVRYASKSRSGFEFTVMVPPGSPYVAAYEAAGAEVEAVRVCAFSKTRSPLALSRMLARLPLSFIEIQKVIRSRKIDLVHSHKINVLVGDLAAKATGTAAVHTFHEVNTGGLWMYRGFGALARSLSDAIVILCDATGELLGEEWRQESKVHKIYNGVDIDGFAAQASAGRDVRAEFGLPADARVVTALSRLHSTKGIEFFVEAAALVLKRRANVCFLMVGDVSGPDPRLLRYRESLRQAADRLGISDSFQFTGIRRDVADILSATNVFVLPSVHDIFPTTVLEAMSLGVPVVATHVGGVPEQIVDGVTGYLVAPRDPAALADRVCDLLDDDELARGMGRAGAARVMQFFTAGDYARNTLGLYEKVLVARGRGPEARPSLPLH